MALTERQRQLIRAIAAGKPLKEISGELQISCKTVEFHWAAVKRLLGFETYVDAALWALSRGWIGNKFGYWPEAREEMGVEYGC